MLKRILIFALLLNTPYIMSSDSSANPSYDVAAICTLTGTICAGLAYKNFKKGWQAWKEHDRHLKILNEMGIKVFKVTKTEFDFGYIVETESYRMDGIPSHFSQEQKKKAKEHWSLLLSSNKDSNKMFDYFGWSAIGSLILLPVGICEFCK